MAKSKTKSASYFSHDSNAKDDFKIMMLIEDLGMEGYGIFWVLIETLREQEDLIYPLRLLSILARKYNTTIAKVEVVVRNYQLFEIENETFFYSHSLNQRMQIMHKKREQARIAGIKSGEARRKKEKEQKGNGSSTRDEQYEKEIEKEIEKKREQLSRIFNYSQI